MLHRLPMVARRRPPAAPVTGFKLEVGTYTRTTSSPEAISYADPSLDPDFIQVKRINSGSFVSGVCRWKLASGGVNDSHYYGFGTAADDTIRVMSPGSFTVGGNNEVYNSTATFGYFACEDTGAGDMAVGEFVGGSQSINLGWRPDLVWCLSQNTPNDVLHTDAAEYTPRFSDDDSLVGAITFTATGFDTSLDGGTWRYIAWNDTSGRLFFGDYQGDGSSARVIPVPGLGGQTLAFASCANTWSAVRPVFQQNGHLDPLASCYHWAGTEAQAQWIRNRAPGQFTVGTSTDVNESGRQIIWFGFV